jgi:hypothetical protein
MGDGSWTPIVYAEGEALVAVREAPARQVYVGLDLEKWSMSKDFVVFMTNLFDWVGEGEERFGASEAGRLGKEWEMAEGGPLPRGTEAGDWPGVYRGGGKLLAVNAADVVPGAGPTDWKEKLAKAAGREWKERQSWGLSPLLIVLALLALLVGAMTWRAQRGPGALALAGVEAGREE